MSKNNKILTTDESARYCACWFTFTFILFISKDSRAGPVRFLNIATYFLLSISFFQFPSYEFPEIRHSISLLHISSFQFSWSFPTFALFQTLFPSIRNFGHTISWYLRYRGYRLFPHANWSTLIWANR